MATSGRAFLDYLAPEIPIFLDEPQFISVLEKQGRYRVSCSQPGAELVISSRNRFPGTTMTFVSALLYIILFPSSLNTAVDFTSIF